MINLTTYANDVTVSSGEPSEFIASGSAGKMGIATVEYDDDDFGRVIKEFEGVMYTVLQSSNTGLQTSMMAVMKSIDGGASWSLVRHIPSVNLSWGHQLVGFDVTKTTSGKTMVYVSEFVIPLPTTSGTQMVRNWAIEVATGIIVDTTATPNVGDRTYYAFRDITIGFPSDTTSTATIYSISNGGRGAMEATSKGLHLTWTVSTVGAINTYRVIYVFIGIDSNGAISAPAKVEELLNSGGTSLFNPSTPSIYVDSNGVPTIAFGTKLAYGSATGNGTYPNVQLWRKDTTLPVKRSSHKNIWSMTSAWKSVTGSNSSNSSLMSPRNVNLRFVPKVQSSQGVDTWYLGFVYANSSDSIGSQRIGVIQSIDNGVTWTALEDMENKDDKFRGSASYEKMGNLSLTIDGSGREHLSWTYHYRYASDVFRLFRYKTTKLKSMTWGVVDVHPQLNITESVNRNMNKAISVGSLPVSPRVLIDQPMLRSSTLQEIAGTKYFGDAVVGTISDVVEFPASATPPTVNVDIASKVKGITAQVVVKGTTDTVIHTEEIPSTGILKKSVPIPTSTWASLPYGAYRNSNNQRLAVATQLVLGGKVLGEKNDFLSKVLSTDSKVPEVLTASSDLSNNTLTSVHTSIKTFVAKTQPLATSVSLASSSDMLQNIKVPVEASMSLTSSSSNGVFNTSTGSSIYSTYVTIDTAQLGFIPDSVVISSAKSVDGTTYWQRGNIVSLAIGDGYNCIVSDGSSSYTLKVPYMKGLMKFPILLASSLVDIKLKGVK